MNTICPNPLRVFGTLEPAWTTAGIDLEGIEEHERTTTEDTESTEKLTLNVDWEGRMRLISTTCCFSHFYAFLCALCVLCG